jgi:ABC-type multidrug transport system ATPase subunit
MMEEADTLCNRIGILTSGVLRTVETSIKLKKTYGEGYNVVVNTLRE